MDSIDKILGRASGPCCPTATLGISRHHSASPHHLLSSQGDTRCPSPWQSDTQPPLTSCKVGMKLDLIRTDTSDTAICPISCIISHIFLNLRTGYGSFGYWYLSHIYIINPILSLRIRIQSEIKCLNFDTDYPYCILTLFGQTYIRNYPFSFHPHRRDTQYSPASLVVPQWHLVSLVIPQ
jgi:hypothetical protein